MAQHTDLPTEQLSRLMHLFQQQLSDLTFPGVDLQTLEQAQRDHAAAEAELAEAEELAMRAREALDTQQTTVAGLVERAIAYLRVYANDDAELLAKLDQLSPKRRPTVKGRRRKTTEKAEPDHKTSKTSSAPQPDLARAS